MQLVLITASFHWIGSVEPYMQSWWELAAVAATLGLGGMLLVQLPKALLWRPRINHRASAEVMEERRRIARDLHDTLGSQLVSAIALLDLSKHNDRSVHTLLKRCMLDLRLLVDAMDGAEAPFEVRLAQLRYRMEPVCAHQGIRLLWDVQTSQSASILPASIAAHLVAIVQEALSNALQHAKATEIYVCAKDIESDGYCWVEISDNGQGIRSQQNLDGLTAAGRGIVGMSLRAHLAGGHLSVQRGHAGGTSVRAVVPCSRSQ